MAYPIPPWLTQADPVASYTHGLQIGAQIGQENAAQQLRQESIARQQQKDQIEAEIEQAKLHLSADAAARKYSAQQKYQDLVGSGVDPIQALLKVGPEMGINGPALAQLTKENQPKEPFSLNVQEQDGEKFLQTSPNSFQHIPSRQLEKTAPPKVHFNPDGTVSVFDDEEGLTVIGKPRATKTGKARYTFKKGNGDTISGTTDDPEVADLVQKAKDAAKKAEQEANAPGAGFHPLDAIMRFLHPAAPQQTNAPSFKILGIRRKDDSTPVPDLSSESDQPDDQ